MTSGEAKVVVWTSFACVAVSILAHGVTALPLSERWLPEPGSEPGSASSRAARRMARYRGWVEAASNLPTSSAKKSLRVTTASIRPAFAIGTTRTR